MFNREAKKLFLFYIGIFYIFPFAVALIVPEAFSSIYKGFDLLTGALFISFFVALVLLLERIAPHSPFRLFKRLGGLFERKWLNIILATAFLILSFRFSQKYGLNFRQNSGESISQTGIEGIILFTMRTYAIAYILFINLKAVNDLPIFIWQRIVMAITGVSFAFIIMASMDVIYILGCFIIVIKRERLLYTAFKIKRKSISGRVIRLIFFSFLIVAAIFVGYADKIGADRATEFFSDVKNVETIAEHTTARIGIWYASVMSVGSHDIFDNSLALNTLDGISSNLTSRFNILRNSGSGGEAAKRPDSWSSSRVNYLLTFKENENIKTGSSPGLVASSFYLPYFPFNFILMALYAIFIMRKFGYAMQYAKKTFNFFGRFMILFYFAMSLFANPVDYINVINPSFIFLLLYIGAMDTIHSLSGKMRIKEFIKMKAIVQRENALALTR